MPRPTVRDDQVLVGVHAAGLDRGTEHLMTGKPYAVRLAVGLRRPKNPVPGRDVAGTVIETGAGVTRFCPGDEVYGVAPGSFAEYVRRCVDCAVHSPPAGQSSSSVGKAAARSQAWPDSSEEHSLTLHRTAPRAAPRP